MMNQYPKYERYLVFQDDQLPLNVSTWKNHPDYPLHLHDFSQIAIIINGKGIKRVKDVSYPISTGDVFVFHDGEPHGYFETEDLALINVVYDHRLLKTNHVSALSMPGYQALFCKESKTSSPNIFKRHIKLSLSDLNRVRSISNSIELELKTSTNQNLSLKFSDRHKFSPKAAQAVDQSSYLIALGYFYILVGTLARLYTSKTPQYTQYIKKISSTITYIEKHFDQPIDISEIIKKFGFSRRNFYRSFVNLTGLTPNNYLLRIRISHALHLLQTSSASITDIAFECGFENSNYFSRQFRKIMRTSPRIYREQLLTTLKNTAKLAPHVDAQQASAFDATSVKSRTIHTGAFKNG